MLGQRQRELSLGLRENRLEALGGHLVLEAGELVGYLGGQHVEACAQELPHLDHEAAHADGERAEPHGGLPVAFRAAASRPRAQADATQEDLPEDEAEGDPAKEEHDAPVARAKL